MKQRRRIVFALGATAFSIPLASFGQQAIKVNRIGFLNNVSSESATARFEAFRQGLRELNYIEGRNVVIEFRSSGGNPDRMSALITEMRDLKVDVIVADGGSEFVRAAKSATQTIPIVFNIGGDPVALGFVSSLARPGGNLTGLSFQGADLARKLLQLLKEVVPGAKRILFLSSATNPSAVSWRKNIEAATRILSIKLDVIELRSSADLQRSFSEIARKPCDGIILFNDSMLAAESPRIAAFATARKIATISGNTALPQGGGLMSYGASRTQMTHRAAAYVDKILKGAKPGDLPVEQPTKFELVINKATAKALGLTIPQSLLISADKVIE